MPARRRPRYRVRLRTALAGSVFAAATAASLTGFTAAPALAAPPRSVSASSTAGSTYAEGALAALSSGDTSTTVALARTTTASAERLAGVRAELDGAVLLRLVTPEQADGFYAQIERRVAAGL